MRVVHIVTLVTPNAAGGGPVSVAFNLVREIQSRGHDVVLLAAARGYDALPKQIGNVRVKLWPARRLRPFKGVVGIFAPAMLVWLWRHRAEFDVVHVHMGRDLVTLPAAALALLLGKRVVIQTHGMVDVSDHPLAPLLDRFMTRPVLRHAHAVLYLTKQERRDLFQIGGDVSAVELPNGVPVAEDRAHLTGTSERPEVLFLARLHERKRPQLFVEAAGVLLAEGIHASFALVGPDEGEGSKVRRAIEDLGDDARYVTWEGGLAPEKTTARMSCSSIHVLPAVNEPFGMSLLEAMSVGLPVIATESCGLADAIRESGSGIIVDEAKESLVDAMRKLLLDPRLREEMGRAAYVAASQRFGMESVGSRLLNVYAGVAQCALENSSRSDKSGARTRTAAD